MIVNVSSNFNNEVYTFLFSFEIETVYFIKKKIVISAKITTSKYRETPSIHTEKFVSLWERERDFISRVETFGYLLLRVVAEFRWKM